LLEGAAVLVRSTVVVVALEAIYLLHYLSFLPAATR
jgi:hypothetical protein